MLSSLKRPNRRMINRLKLPLIVSFACSLIIACSPAKDDLKSVEETKVNIIESGASVQDNLPSKYSIGKVAEIGRASCRERVIRLV